jgi:short-subunit dehydrogenase
MQKEQQYALITGASNGIGYELAKVFAKENYNLVLVARSEEHLNARAEELKQQYGIDTIIIAKDLFDREAPMDIYEEVKKKGIQIDVLVNDAGQGQYGLFVDTDIDRELDIVQLNIGAYLMLTKPFLKDMVARGSGKILNVSSIGSKIVGPYESVYHGTKAFVQSWSEAVRSEVKDKGVTVTTLLPGPTATDFFNKSEMQDSKLVKDGSLADPAKVAQDGYDALIAGQDMIVSGFKNKAMVAASNLMPDTVVADQMKKMAEPSNSNS